jgi:hypothetical protein
MRHSPSVAKLKDCFGLQAQSQSLYAACYWTCAREKQQSLQACLLLLTIMPCTALAGRSHVKALSCSMHDDN